MTDRWRIHVGDALLVLRTLADASIDCVVTSPPYWGLRDYGVKGQIGLERTPEEYLARMIVVFSEIHRVLKKRGTCWVNMGDCYVADRRGGESIDTVTLDGRRNSGAPIHKRPTSPRGGSLKPKDLVGMPWRLALSLQAAGWFLRSDVIWAKKNPMPESVKDRPTRSHEYVFLLVKGRRYFYDCDAVREPYSYNGGLGSHHRNVTGPVASDVPGTRPNTGLHRSSKRVPTGWDTSAGSHHGKAGRYSRENVDRVPRARKGGEREVPAFHPDGRNKRSVWTIATQAFRGSHTATFPEELARTCILAGCPQGGLVLDPFSGSARAGVVALKLGCRYVGIELNPAWAADSERDLAAVEIPTLLENAKT